MMAYAAIGGPPQDPRARAVWCLQPLSLPLTGGGTIWSLGHGAWLEDPSWSENNNYTILWTHSGRHSLPLAATEALNRFAERRACPKED